MVLHISQTSRYILPDNRSHYALLEDAPRERRSRLDQGDGPDGSATDAISQPWGASRRRCGYCISRNRHVHVAPAYRLQMARPALGPDADIVVLDNDWQMVVVTARGQWQHGARAS